MNNTYIVYHANCLDGFGAAWAARHALGPDINFIPASHGSTPPSFPAGAQVFIFDFSYDRDTLTRINEHCDLVLLDHHQTAEKDLIGLDFATFDMNRSGAMMAWDYFFPDQEAPDLLKWIQDRDLWRWEYEDSKAATAAIQAYPREFEVWDDLMANPQKLVAAGLVALSLTEQQVDQICKNSYMSDVAGFTVPVANATCYWSEVGNTLCKRFPDSPFSATWYLMSNGSKKWSLRSIGDFDVSAIAKNYGGGGHKNAAGFASID